MTTSLHLYLRLFLKIYANGFRLALRLIALDLPVGWLQMLDNTQAAIRQFLWVVHSHMHRLFVIKSSRRQIVPSKQTDQQTKIKLNHTQIFSCCFDDHRTNLYLVKWTMVPTHDGESNMTEIQNERLMVKFMNFTLWLIFEVNNHFDSWRKNKEYKLGGHKFTKLKFFRQKATTKRKCHSDNSIVFVVVAEPLIVWEKR